MNTYFSDFKLNGKEYRLFYKSSYRGNSKGNESFRVFALIQACRFLKSEMITKDVISCSTKGVLATKSMYKQFSKAVSTSTSMWNNGKVLLLNE